MPSTAPARPLHRGTCMDDLNRECELKLDGKTPKLICNGLSKILEKGIAHKSAGDDEMAYIFFMRFINCIHWLQKTPEFLSNKNLLKPYVSGTKVYETLNSLEEISNRLKRRYEAKRLEDSTKLMVNNVEKMQFEPEHTNDDDLLDEMGDVQLNLPDTPTDDPASREPETAITCMKMFQEIQRLQDRIIIIDIRSREDFQNSHIKHDQCINIPADVIKAGKLATEIFKSLQRDERTVQVIRYRDRQYCDLIVLLDWQTTKASLKPANQLNVIKSILWDWDPGVAYQRIVVLDGGYKEWLTCYPTKTTNASVAVPDIEGNSFGAMLEDVEYPDFIHSDEEPPMTKVKHLPVPPERSLKPAIQQKKIVVTRKSSIVEDRNADGANPFYDTDKTKIYPNNLTGQLKTRTEIIDDSPNSGTKNFQANDPTPGHNSIARNSIVNPLEDEVAKPVIDRSSKPSAVKTYDADSKKILSLMKQKSDVVKSKMKLEDEKLILERELFDKEDEDGNFEQKAETMRRIELLNKTVMEKTKQHSDIEEKLHQYERNSINVDPAHSEEQVQLELDIGLARQKAQNVVIQRRAFINERNKKLEENLEMRQKNMSTPPRETEGDSETVPLKEDGPSINSSLKRSYSSPNLAQLESRKESGSRKFDNKMPQVDRTSKPLQQQQEHRNNIVNSNFIIKQPLRRDREQRMNPIYGNVHPGITGLKNLGNSCYMNSIIQCLSNTTSLARYFIQGYYTEDLTTKNRKTEGQVAEEVAQVIKALWCGHYRSISPRDLKVVIGQYKMQFESTEQQDSHEFLTFLLDWMHSDLKTKAKVEPERLISNADKEWDKSMGGQTSIISQLFFGQLRSTITCATCGNSSTTYESFNSLTLSLPDSNKCTLDDCIRKYVSGQRVSGWRCPSCKVERDATKKFDFVKLAPIIVVHLNRFGETGGWIQKTNTAVDFPLVSLDLRSYVAHDSGSTTNTMNSLHPTYNLYAVSNHYGTMEGGHYTAYCNSASQNKWYKYDDHTVREVPPSEVRSQTASAYLLFYTCVPTSPYFV